MEEMTVERAGAIVGAAPAWIGWELWEIGAERIRIDGALSPIELSALLVLLQADDRGR